MICYDLFELSCFSTTITLWMSDQWIEATKNEKDWENILSILKGCLLPVAAFPTVCQPRTCRRHHKDGLGKHRYVHEQIRMARLAKWSDSEWFHLAFRRFEISPILCAKKNELWKTEKLSKAVSSSTRNPPFCCTHVQHRGNFCRVDSKSDPDFMSLSV